MKQSRSNLGELLVVLGIIAVLTGILFPVFKSAREKSHESQCAYNEKQIAIAMFQYANDYGQTYPPGVGKSGETFDTLLLPYTEEGGFSGPANYGVFHCPDDNVRRYRNNPPRTYGLAGAWRDNFDSLGDLHGLGGQGFWGAYDKTSKYTFPRRADEIPNAADTLMLAERPARSMYIGSPKFAVLGPQDQNAFAPLSHHAGGWNYTFADGHSQWLLPEKTVGAGIHGSGRGSDGKPCTMAQPCGIWTRDPND